MYGFEDTNKSPFTFGLNAGAAKMVKFDYITHGGKDEAEQEAVDIIFNINGVEKSYRKFPVTKAYYKEEGTTEQKETTDPNHEAFKKEVTQLNAVLTHIMTCFVEKSVLKQTLQDNPPTGFKSFIEILKNSLPEDFSNVTLDIFMQYQWQITGTNNKTYLELPKNMKHGPWVCKEVDPVGAWKEMKVEKVENNEVALYYVNENNRHPFTKNGWFMSSNFAKQQKEEDETDGALAASGETTTKGADW